MIKVDSLTLDGVVNKPIRFYFPQSFSNKKSGDYTTGTFLLLVTPG
jgi:hypothetical protein